jgi:hypothetical protein
VKSRFLRYLASAAAVSALALFALAPLAAQSSAVGDPHSTQIPRMSNGKPDLSGVWQIPYVPDMSRGIGPLPFTAWGEANWKSYDPSKFDYTGHCLPAGLTREMNTPMPIEIVQKPKRMAIMFEGFSSFVVIPTDGRDHPKKLEPTWLGDSVGHWEGDTLVVDSIGFNDKTRLDTIGHPHSDQLHVVQRFMLTDPMHLAYDVTVDDPKTFTKEWSNHRTFKLRPDWELMEYSCEENNKDLTEGHIK